MKKKKYKRYGGKKKDLPCYISYRCLTCSSSVSTDVNLKLRKL